MTTNGGSVTAGGVAPGSAVGDSIVAGGGVVVGSAEGISVVAGKGVVGSVTGWVVGSLL